MADAAAAAAGVGPGAAGFAPAPPAPPAPQLPPVPQINDAYWFNYSKTTVDGALKSRDDAADRLQTYVGWLWTVYTLGAAVGFSLGKLSLNFWPAVLVSSPVLALVVVYWMTVWVRVPALRSFDPQIPRQIELVYERNLQEKQKRLKLTLAAAAASALFVSSALFYASTASTAPSPPSAPSLQTVVHAGANGHQLFVSGSLGDVSKVAVTVYGFLNKQRGDILMSEATTSDKGFFRSGPIPLAKTFPQQVLIEATATLNSGGPTIVASKSLDISTCSAPVCN